MIDQESNKSGRFLREAIEIRKCNSEMKGANS